jgi:hypothetical protein
MTELPKYKCHKEVRALKIADVKDVGNRSGNGELTEIVKEISFIEDGYDPIRVDGRWWGKHQPKPGGYYVVYADGYVSFSPAEAFEGGYTKIT